MSTRVSEKELVNKLCAKTRKVIDKHDLDKDDFLALGQVSFPHGRADAVLYGLYKGLYVVPIGVEVKTKIESGTELFRYVDQMRGIYEYAFAYIYLALQKIHKNVRELVKKYLSDIGYGLIEIGEDDVNVIVPASPKKPYRSRRDYNEVASRGLLYISARRALMDEGFDVKSMNISSLWMGLKSPINYCAFLYGNYAAFGVYALGLENVRKLLRFLMGRKNLVQSLGERGYRVYLESYLAVRGVRGYIHHFDEPVSLDVVKTLDDKIKQRVKPMPVPRWGSGLGIYKRLWNVENVPTYPTALRSIKATLATDRLGIFLKKGIIAST